MNLCGFVHQCGFTPPPDSAGGGASAQVGAIAASIGAALKKYTCQFLLAHPLGERSNAYDIAAAIGVAAAGAEIEIPLLAGVTLATAPFFGALADHAARKACGQ